jgi:hypothetical protein
LHKPTVLVALFLPELGEMSILPKMPPLVCLKAIYEKTVDSAIFAREIINKKTEI